MEPAIQDDPNNDDDDDDDDNDELLALQQVTTNDERDTGVMVRVCAVMVGAPWILLVWILLTSPPPPTTTTTTIVNPMRSSDSMDSTSKIPHLPQIGPVREFTLVVTPSISGTDCSEIHVNGYAPECTFPSDYMKKGDDSIHDQEPLLMLTHESGNDIDEEGDESASSYSRRALEFEQQHTEDEIESINTRFHHSRKEDVPMPLPENQQCSFSDIATRSFGTHYSTGVKKVLLGELEESNDPFQTAAAKIAMLWITSQAPSIFKVMANFRYVDEHDLEFEYNAKLINFIRVERVSNQIHFVFQETSPGIVTEEFLLFLQDQFRGGGASWDEFGDVTQYCAANHGFRDEWDQVMEMPGVAVQGRGLNVNVRVSFLDFKAKSVGIGPQNLRR